MSSIKLDHIENFSYENEKMILNFSGYTSPKTKLQANIDDEIFTGESDESGLYQGRISLLKNKINTDAEIKIYDSNKIEIIRQSVMILINDYLSDHDNKPAIELCHSPLVRKFLLDLKVAKANEAKSMLQFIPDTWKKDEKICKFLTEYFVKQHPDWFYGDILPKYPHDYVVNYSMGQMIVSHIDHKFIFLDQKNVPVPPLLLDINNLVDKNNEDNEKSIVTNNISKLAQVFLLKNPNQENILHPHPIEKTREFKSAFFTKDYSLVIVKDAQDQKNIYLDIRKLDIKKNASSILKIFYSE